MPRRVTAQGFGHAAKSPSNGAPFLRNPYRPFGATASRHGSQKPSPRGGVKVREAPRSGSASANANISFARSPLGNSSAPPRAQGSIGCSQQGEREPSWPTHIPNPQRSHNRCAEALAVAGVQALSRDRSRPGSPLPQPDAGAVAALKDEADTGDLEGGACGLDSAKRGPRVVSIRLMDGRDTLEPSARSHCSLVGRRGEEKPALGSTRDEATEACGSRNSRLTRSPQTQTKTISRLIVLARGSLLCARSAGSLRRR